MITASRTRFLPTTLSCIFSPLFDIAHYRRRVSGETSLICPPSVIPVIPPRCRNWSGCVTRESRGRGACHGGTAPSDLYTARHSASLCPSDAHSVARQLPNTNYIAPKEGGPAERKAGGKTQRCVMADHAAQPVLPSSHAVERTTRRGLTRDLS